MNQSADQHFFSMALARARAARAEGDLTGVWRELRDGLDGPADYSSAVVAAKFLENTSKGGSPPGWPTRRVALVGADTLTFLLPVMRTLAFRDGWWPIFYEAPFGTWRQEILEPGSKLRNFSPQVTLVLRSWHALQREKVDTGQVVEEELALAQCAAEGLGIVLWPGYDFPDQDSGLHPVLTEVNQRLRAALPPGMLWVDLAELQTVVGARWDDERLWEAIRQHPSLAGSVALVECWLALLRARWGQSRKVLVTDLDNVLWGGVVGEDGVECLRIGAGTPAGEAHLAYQRYLVELKDRGVLLAVCSKNNDPDAREVFARREMPLRREDFSGWMVNWNDKADNLRALAAKLQLGLDSFIFVDDQPAERARVRQALPAVAVPELPADPTEYVARLKARRFFETLSSSAEDLGRTAAYRANTQREEARGGAASLEDFLRGLDMVAEHRSFSDATLDRVEQLLARTNQWNLTTRRHSRAEVASFMARPGVLTQWFRLRDRFGDNGLVGLWIVVPRVSGEWEIESWVMSCRVIGRGLEDLMFNSLIEHAQTVGAHRLHGIFRPTSKNGLVAGLLPDLGFTAGERKKNSDEQIFTLDLASVTPRPHFIRAGSTS